MRILMLSVLNIRPDQLGFMVNQLALGQVSLPVLHFPLWVSLHEHTILVHSWPMQHKLSNWQRLKVTHKTNDTIATEYKNLSLLYRHLYKNHNNNNINARRCWEWKCTKIPEDRLPGQLNFVQWRLNCVGHTPRAQNFEAALRWLENLFTPTGEHHSAAHTSGAPISSSLGLQNCSCVLEGTLVWWWTRKERLAIGDEPRVKITWKHSLKTRLLCGAFRWGIALQAGRPRFRFPME